MANLPPGVQPGLSPWSPTGEIVRYVLEGPMYTTNQLKAVQDWVLQRTLKTVPGVIDVTGYGGTVKQYQVLVNTNGCSSQYNVTLKQVEDAIGNSNANVGGDVLTLGSQAHNVRTLGLIGRRHRSRLTRTAIERFRQQIQTREARRYQERGGHLRPTAFRSSSARWPTSSKGIGRGSGSLAGLLKVKDGKRVATGEDEDDVIEGIVLMRKYEKSLVTAEPGREEDRKS